MPRGVRVACNLITAFDHPCTGCKILTGCLSEVHISTCCPTLRHQATALERSPGESETQVHDAKWQSLRYRWSKTRANSTAPAEDVPRFGGWPNFGSAARMPQ